MGVPRMATGETPVLLQLKNAARKIHDFYIISADELPTLRHYEPPKTWRA
jgi:hypothetical protein